LYEKFSANLNPETRMLFDAAYGHFDYDGKRLGKSALFHNRNWVKATAMERNAYLQSERNYLRMRDIMDERPISFVQLDMLKERLNGTYDVINLSNVPNFLIGKVFTDLDDKVTVCYDKFLVPLRRNLKKGGKLFCYTYSKGLYRAQGIDTYPLTDEWSKYLERDEFDCTSFECKGIVAGRDRVIVLTKK